MPAIEISNLHPVGYELFQGTESFLDELAVQEVEGVRGGCPGWNYHDFLLLVAKLSIATPDLQQLQDGRSIATVYGNSINNNTVYGQTINARTAANANTVA